MLICFDLIFSIVKTKAKKKSFEMAKKIKNNEENLMKRVSIKTIEIN